MYSGWLKFNGEEHENTLRSATNYARYFTSLGRFEEARSLLRKTLPVARRVTRDTSDISIRMRTLYAQSLFFDAAATLDDLREAVATLEELARTARRVLGGAHPMAVHVDDTLRRARAVLRAREAGMRVVFDTSST